MEATLDAWNLSSNRQICLTTDNGTNIINATGCLEWLRLSCFGHNLHLAITNSVKNMSLDVAELLVCATKLFLHFLKAVNEKES